MTDLFHVPDHVRSLAPYIGGKPIEEVAREFGLDPARIVKLASNENPLGLPDSAKHPSNPTGTFVEAAALEAFLAAVSPRTVVVLDEAYTEYLDPALRFDSTRWVRRFANLVVSRTFSKAYGLAGLRVGYGVAQPALTGLMNRVRAAFNVNLLAQAAAVAVLDDDAFLAESYRVNRAGYAQLTAAFDAMGVVYIPSSGNFVLFKAGEASDAGAKANLALLKRGVIVRPVANYGLPQWLRVSIGTEAENATFLAALPDALRAAGETRAAA